MLNSIAKPFGLLLMFLYDLVNNYGLAVILFAVVIKLILLPFQMKSKRGMMQTSRLTPRLKELEKKHAGNKQKYNEEVQKLYREENVKPMSGCLWSLIPLPIMLALFQAIRYPLTIMMGLPAALLEEGGAIAVKLAELGFESKISAAYVQIEQAQFINTHFGQFQSLAAEGIEKLRMIDFSFLGINLGAVPQWNFLWKTDWSDAAVWGPGLIMFLIPVISGALTYLSTKISAAMNKQQQTAAGPDATQQTMGMMNVFMPLMSVYFAFIMPSAIGIYWIASTLLAVIQDTWLTKRYTKIMDAEDAARCELRARKEAELEEKRKETERLKAENPNYANPNVSKKKKQALERQESREKAAEWDKKHKPDQEEGDDPARVGTRRYARGRAYSQERFGGDAPPAPDMADEPDEQAALPEGESAPAEAAEVRPDSDGIEMPSLEEIRMPDAEDLGTDE